MRFETVLVVLTMVAGLTWLASWAFKWQKNWFNDLCKSLFPVLLLVLVLRSFLFEPFRIPSGSMKPTLLEGDFILVNKFKYGIRLPITGQVIIPISKPKLGDIVIFRQGDMDVIKRVIGLPGDHVVYQNDKLYINGKLIDSNFYRNTVDYDSSNYKINTQESIEHLGDIKHHIYHYPEFAAAQQHKYQYKDIIVPEGSYFVLGDNRTGSNDSRFWGFVEDKDLLGKGLAVWMSWDSRGNDVRWNRIGKSMYE